jgi:hypothetical protein
VQQQESPEQDTTKRSIHLRDTPLDEKACRWSFGLVAPIRSGSPRHPLRTAWTVSRSCRWSCYGPTAWTSTSSVPSSSLAAVQLSRGIPLVERIHRGRRRVHGCWSRRGRASSMTSGRWPGGVTGRRCTGGRERVISGLQHDLDRTVGLALENVVRVRRLLQREPVAGELIDSGCVGRGSPNCSSSSSM